MSSMATIASIHLSMVSIHLSTASKIVVLHQYIAVSHHYTGASHHYIAVWHQYIAVSHQYIAIPDQYIALLHQYISLLHQYISVPHQYIAIPHQYIAVLHQYIAVLHQYITILALYIAVSHQYIAVNTLQFCIITSHHCTITSQLFPFQVKDGELGAIVNRDLSRRVRSVSALSAHKTVVLNDLKLAARIIQELDSRHKIWNQNESSESSFGLHSDNPILKDITEYLVEEASAEEEELLGQGVVPDDSKNKHAQAIKVIEKEVNDYCEQYKTKLDHLMRPPEQLSDSELASLGAKSEDVEVEKFIQANTQELAKDKWLCPLSGPVKKKTSARPSRPTTSSSTADRLPVRSSGDSTISAAGILSREEEAACHLEEGKYDFVKI
ncbi:unnamed protein product [Nesidiocoris tenuis]|uniref:SERRATE/Ars2 C-terminal domain-containing protein n=1 Tax=Nesidiocoris tenuis TaxID=355587 RepID=A0A6H5GMU5_9HEMI|nr:unnamed protein product [Nesidiocoris tenuis]